MKMRIKNTFFSSVLALACLVFLNACIPTSEHPLKSPNAVPQDQKLLGAWEGYFGDEDETTFLHFVELDEDEANNGYRAIMVGYDNGDAKDGGIATFDVTTAKIDDNTYINARWLTDDDEAVADEAVGLHFVRYVLEDDKSLSLAWISQEKLMEAVENGTLKGEVSGGGFMRGVHITSSSEELTQFIRSQPVDELFPETLGEFSRIH